MQLKIQRTQRLGGVLGRTVVFCLDVRAEYTRAESENIRKYKIGSELIYASQAARRHGEAAGRHLDRTQEGGAGERFAGLAHGVFSLAMAKMNLNITIASLGQGQHVECKDLRELMEAEEAVMNACRNVRDYLALAATFNGSVVLVDFTDGEKILPPGSPLQIAGPTDTFPEEIVSDDVQPNAPSPMVDAESTLPLQAAAETAIYREAYDLPSAPRPQSWTAEALGRAYAHDPTTFHMVGLVAAAVAILWIWGATALTGIIALALVVGAIVLGWRRGAI